MTRIWNITDGGQAGVSAHSRMVLGKLLKPGHSLKVKKSRLTGATKIQKDVDSKLLSIGDQPPAWYSQKKKPPRAVADGRRIDSSGRTAGKRVKVAPGHAAPAKPSKSEVKKKKEVKAIPEEIPAPDPQEDKAVEETLDGPISEESKTSGFGSGRRKRK